jgi:hypothetical protein
LSVLSGLSRCSSICGLRFMKKKSTRLLCFDEDGYT